MIEAIIFDAYGTLFDVYSVGALAEQLFPGYGKALSKLWRDKQIEYTRLRTMSNMYKPFSEVTEDALVFSCKELGLNCSSDDKNALMNQYSKLPAFKENVEVLQALKVAGIKLAILRFVACAFQKEWQTCQTITSVLAMQRNHLLIFIYPSLQ